MLFLPRTLGHQRRTAGFLRDLGFPRTTWPNRCLSPRTPRRTAVFFPDTYPSHVRKSAFLGTWAVHGPRGPTAVFEHERLAELLFLPRTHGHQCRKADFPRDLGCPQTTWSNCCLSLWVALQNCCFFLPRTHPLGVGKPTFLGTWVVHGTRGRTAVSELGHHAELLFLPRHMGTGVGKPPFPVTSADQGPRSRTAIF